MIKFFRQIRQRLIGENRFSKYSLYAIGEIILVVIGILIALQINNWNELNKEKKQTSVYVNNLIEDLTKDSFMYQDQINAARLKYQFCKEIHDVIINNQKIIDTSAFIINLQSAGRLTIPTVTDNTYRDLVSTGNLKLIDDNKSIEAIRAYYSNPLEWWYQEYTNQLVNGYLPIVVDAIPMELHEEILGNEIVDRFKNFTDNALINNKISGYSEEDVLVILNELRDNESFRFQLKRITRSHLVQLKILSLSEKSANELLSTLKEWQHLN